MSGYTIEDPAFILISIYFVRDAATTTVLYRGLECRSPGVDSRNYYYASIDLAHLHHCVVNV